MTVSAPPVAVQRTGEIEEPTNLYVIHPMSRALVTRLARWGVSPNAVSLAGLALGTGAALSYTQYERWPFVALGFVLMIGWHVMDGADGQLARLTGKTSQLGQMLDGFCDHGTFLLVYLCLAWAAAQDLGAWVWLAAVAAGASHAVQASVYEAQRFAYDLWVQGKTSARIPTPDEFRPQLAEKRGMAWLLSRLYMLYIVVQHRTGASATALRERLEAASAAPGGAARVRDVYREIHRPGLRRWNLLCSNYRTVAVAVACLLGSPVFFFAFDAVVLNVVFALLLAMQRRHDRELLARLAEPHAA